MKCLLTEHPLAEVLPKGTLEELGAPGNPDTNFLNFYISILFILLK